MCGVLGEDQLFVGKLDVVCESWVDGSFEHFPHSFNDVLAVLSCVHYPADSLLEGVSLAAFRLVKAALAINGKHFLDHFEDVEEESPFGKVAGSPH